MKVAKALESLTVEEFLDGESSTGVVNISNFITIKTATGLIEIQISSEGTTVMVDNDLVYER